MNPKSASNQAFGVHIIFKSGAAQDVIANVISTNAFDNLIQAYLKSLDGGPAYGSYILVNGVIALNWNEVDSVYSWNYPPS